MSNIPTVKSIVAAYLRANGYDGLYWEDCGCLLDDLMPCYREGIEHCEPGYMGPCTCGDGCFWHVGPATEPRVPGQRLVTVMCGQAEQERLDAAVVEAGLALYRVVKHGGAGAEMSARIGAVIDAAETLSLYWITGGGQQ